MGVAHIKLGGSQTSREFIGHLYFSIKVSLVGRKNNVRNPFEVPPSTTGSRGHCYYYYKWLGVQSKKSNELNKRELATVVTWICFAYSWHIFRYYQHFQIL